jgi:hypothetical protein
MDRDAAFEKLVDELEKAGLVHGPAFLGAVVIKKLDLVLDKTEGLLKELRK